MSRHGAILTDDEAAVLADAMTAPSWDGPGKTDVEVAIADELCDRGLLTRYAVAHPLDPRFSATFESPTRLGMLILSCHGTADVPWPS